MTTRYAEAHVPKNLRGPGDGRPTALQIIQDNNLVGKLGDKIILVTGTSSGIGIETVRALKATGAKIYATTRDLDKGRRALREILEPGRVELLVLDTNSLDSVRRCAKDFLSRQSHLNILICNAGTMATPEHTLSPDGFETQFATNHLGHFLLFQLLKSTLLASSSPSFHSRVVNVSSIGHLRSPIVFDDINLAKSDAYEPYLAYGQSKTANILMALEIEERYGSKGLHGWSLHPGGINSGLHVYADFSKFENMPEVSKTIKSVEQGAATTVFAAIDAEIEGKGGMYLDKFEVAQPFDEDAGNWLLGGVAEWAYDKEMAAKLWEVSNEMVKFSESSVEI